MKEKENTQRENERKRNYILILADALLSKTDIKILW